MDVLDNQHWYVENHWNKDWYYYWYEDESYWLYYDIDYYVDNEDNLNIPEFKIENECQFPYEYRYEYKDYRY